MRPRHDPRRLDLAAAAAQGEALDGRWPMADLRRLAEDHPADAPPLAGDAVWSARASQRSVAGALQTWLTLRVDATVWRTCQRCLQPVALGLQVERALRFVEGEQAAAAIDADSDDDVLVLEPRLDLRELVEDELLLALPLVPRHADCALDVTADDDARDEGSQRPNPFAALATLRAEALRGPDVPEELGEPGEGDENPRHGHGPH